MDFLIKEHKEMLLQLTANKVDFMLIGGYSVIYYGYSRGTEDMDIWLKPDNRNKEKLITTLSKLGINREDLDKLGKLDFTIPQVFFIGKKPLKIDFLTHVEGVTWDEAVGETRRFPLENEQIPVVAYHHLITMKMVSSRARDKNDVEQLQHINKYRNKK
ncbi:MAG TPA: nucleotidyltransferase [Bacteroidales bacterium]|nr:nucleotidyltransferase [Bacteroidales bacterium]